MSNDKNTRHRDTLCCHREQEPDAVPQSRTVPISQKTSCVFESTSQAADLFILEGTGYIYTRLMNPTSDFLEGRVTAFEEGVGISLAASGMAAEMIAFAPLAKQGNSWAEGDIR